MSSRVICSGSFRHNDMAAGSRYTNAVRVNLNAIDGQATASSTLNLRVGDPNDFRDTPRHKEVSHEQEVYRPTVGRGTWHVPGHRQATQGDVGESEAGPDHAQGGCGWAGLAGCKDRGGA